MQCAADLAMNQYGNYVVQNILETGPDEDVTRLIRRFVGRFYQFSMHKFASNVIEKCIRRASDVERQGIFTEIIGISGKWETGRIVRMSSDQFGNYVIQRIIEFGNEKQ
jgi:ectoine hydroxylase-related dioxygenase (phytanoyl-CoA dioxygenase family)